MALSTYAYVEPKACASVSSSALYDHDRDVSVYDGVEIPMTAKGRYVLNDVADALATAQHAGWVTEEEAASEFRFATTWIRAKDEQEQAAKLKIETLSEQLRIARRDAGAQS